MLNELAKIKLVDVMLPTRQGIDLCNRCITQSSDHQTILLNHLSLQLPTHLQKHERIVKTWESRR